MKHTVKKVKIEVMTLYRLARHPRTPWYCKLVAGASAAYALSPIDIIPDFIPVIGYLDDIVIVPIGMWLAFKLVPGDVLEECRDRARNGAEPAVNDEA